MNNESCGNCRFAFPVPQDLQTKVCRRMPPTLLILGVKQGAGGRVDPIQHCAFPFVGLETWCGEWKPRADGVGAFQLGQYGEVSKIGDLGPGNAGAPNG